MQKLVFEPTAGSPAAMAEVMAADSRYWEPLVKASGWTLQ
jgi:hypothetical protein